MYNTNYSSSVYQSQNYDQIKASCLQRRCLFEDPEFPANNRSVFGVEGPTGKLSKWNGNIVWKRPVEIVRQPQFIADGVSRFDVIQGELGNCWFIAAVANLTLHRDLFVQVVPYQTNAFEPSQYAGVFQFRFWQYGAWVTVVVDDRLPCDRSGSLLFLHSSDRREFWSALLEKAYAKLHGCYSSLAGGTPSEALQDFSGGIIEMIDFDDDIVRTSSKDLWHLLRKAYQRNSLISCVLAGRRGFYEEKTRDGLVRGHAYSVTSVQVVPGGSGGYQAREHKLIRIRNPWGDHYEWKGAWSDGAREWSYVDGGTKSRLGYNPGQDGEFWMCMEDFCTQFTRAEVCHISPDNGGVQSAPTIGPRPWNKYIVEGAWIRGRTAGGSMNNSSYAINPQYFFRFVASDADGDGDADKCTVIVSLMQKAPGASRANRDLLVPIGFRMFKAPGSPPGAAQPSRLDYSYLKSHAAGPSRSSGAYTDSREVSARFEVETGHYCIVPSTFDAGDEAEFLLRVFSEPESTRGGYGGGAGLADSFRNMQIQHPSPAVPMYPSYPGSVPGPPACAYPTYGPGPAQPMFGQYGPGPAQPMFGENGPGAAPPVYPTYGPPAPPPAAYAYPSPPAPAAYPQPPLPHGGPVYGYGPPAAARPACPYPTGNSYPNPVAGAVTSTSYERQPALNPSFDASPQPPTTTSGYPTPGPPNAGMGYPPPAGPGMYPNQEQAPYPNSPYPSPYPPAAGSAPFPPAATVPGPRLPYPTN